MGTYIPNEVVLGALKPIFTPSSKPESSKTAALIQTLGLIPHVEGGYFCQTDEDVKTMPSPYPPGPLSGDEKSQAVASRPGYDDAVRRFSTSIFYLLTHRQPLGRFHRNRSRIIHALHRGRGRYVLLHPDGRLESFIVGRAVERGERLQWVVQGGVWKASYLLEAEDGAAEDVGATEPEGLLISETVVPGFEYADHEFLSERRLGELLPEKDAAALSWLARKGEEPEEPTDSSEESDAPDVNSGETVKIGEAVEINVIKA
ncbi:RmlC-like cupin domain-containing protein [Dactylonectria macrodidyma]|uniref:RmlC-like cupin domain-containing protein n=1 Tax=Dactylonectria macrodidyma TaxID=307937 RepID=A0A9P9J8Z4_9HYPO|nr:RmlC-like cupin domain-containing protein [Dactylonectria macrodidyma]